MRAPSLYSSAFSTALSLSGGCLESSGIACVTQRHKAMEQKRDIFQTCGLPSRAAGWAELTV